mgnify:CR=1 FL=1
MKESLINDQQKIVKRGKKGKPKVTFDTYYGFQNLIKKMDMMNGPQYAIANNYVDSLRGNIPDSDFSDPSSLKKSATEAYLPSISSESPTPVPFFT